MYDYRRTALRPALLRTLSRFAVLRKYERIIAADGTVLAESTNGGPLVLSRKLQPGENFDHEVMTQVDSMEDAA